MDFPHLQSSFERLLSTLTPAISRILDRALSNHEIAVDEATQLFDAGGSDLLAMTAAADYLRSQTIGDVVTYVINRNINFTNVCVKACGFCAFSRSHHSGEGYFLEIDEVVRRALEAREVGATEVCLQAGLSPRLDGHLYIELTRGVEKAAPDLHIH